MSEETYLERQLTIAEINKQYIRLIKIKIKLWLLRRKRGGINDR